MFFRKILLATDFFENSEHAFEVAVDLAKRYEAPLTILHVCAMPVFSYPTGLTYVPTPDIMADIHRAAEHQLRLLAGRASERGVTADALHVDGLPRDEIVRYAEEHGQDLIIVGSHGRRGLSRFTLGSVAERVVRAAKVPVLTVHAPAAGAQEQLGSV